MAINFIVIEEVRFYISRGFIRVIGKGVTYILKSALTRQFRIIILFSLFVLLTVCLPI